MSYILEALKKAQAERQLGSAPDIHTPAPSHVPAPTAGASRKPLLIGLSAGIVIAGIAGVLAWRSQAPAPQVAVLASAAQGVSGEAMPAPAVSSDAAAPAPALAAGTASPAAAVPALAPMPAPMPTPTPTPTSTTAAGSPGASPGAAASAPVAPHREPAQAPRQAANNVTAAEAAPAARPSSAAPPAGEAARPRPSTQPDGRAAPAARSTPAPANVAAASPEAVYLPAPAARAPDPAPVARAPEPVEENLRTLQQLPEAIQREVPRVSVGGYIYSPNPADRLLLVDKMLRREGEELAPGLVLERLMPKYAVMNYRGTRYRVAY